jgi:glycerophosphoryl diester phosphodiesterase
MPTRLPSLRPPIGFAHRGARAHAPENTIEAFRLARRLGATGLESDVWLTADGVAVLDHDGVVRARMRSRRIGEVTRSALPAHIPTLADLYEACGADFDLSLDVKDAAAAPAVVRVARDAGGEAAARLWLCHPRWEEVVAWRALDDALHVVDSTSIRRIKEGTERRAATLAAAGVHAVNLHHSEWTGGLTTLFHRFGVLAFGWDAQFARVLHGLLDIGIDAVYSDHVDRMVDALSALDGNGASETPEV